MYKSSVARFSIKINGNLCPYRTYTRYCHESAQWESQRREEHESVSTSISDSETERPSGKNIDKILTNQADESEQDHSINEEKIEQTLLADWEQGKDYGNVHAIITQVLIIDQKGEHTTAKMWRRINYA